MQPGEWREIPDTQAPWLTQSEHAAIMEAAPAGALGFWGVIGSSGVIRAWNSAALDPEGDRWFFTGGGHRDYGGNEVYQFDFATLTWDRLTAPSAYDSGTLRPFVGPTAVHTYGAVAWNPLTESVWVGGASGFLPGGDSQSPELGIWEFDPEDNTWTLHETDWLPPTQLTFNPETRRMFGIQGFKQDSLQREYEIDGTLVPVNYGYAGMGDHSPSARLVTVGEKMFYINKHAGARRAIVELSGGGHRVLLDSWPQWATDRALWDAGWAFDEKQQRFVILAKTGEVFTWSLSDGEFLAFDADVAPDPYLSGGIQGRFVYLPSADVFAAYTNHTGNVWLYKAADPGEGRAIEANVARAMIGETTFTSIQAAFSAASDGQTVTILPGVWKEGATVTAHNLTIEGNGAHLKDVTVAGKATLVIKGDNTTIRGLEVSGMGGFTNAAAIRQEGVNLTLRGVYFHDGNQGVLAGNKSGSTIIVQDGLFERLGAGGSAHGIYANKIDGLIIQNSKFLAAKGEGHAIKSRAATTLIESSVVASLDGRDSRLIDIPVGGEIVIRNNVLQMGPKTANNDAIAVNLEQRNPDNAHDWPKNTIRIEGNTILDDRGRDSRLLHYRDWEDRGFPAPVMTGNTVVGFSSSQVPAGNTWHPNRDAAGLPPYPFLPEAPTSDDAAEP
tara:strand:+ start:17368 stop:19374 length:2007 start_codon:yes stop_codon:yes gene_type:complete